MSDNGQTVNDKSVLLVVDFHKGGLRFHPTVDDAMVAAHGERHAVADHDLVAIINHRDFHDFANGENEALRWIDDSRETVDPHAAEILDGERAALKFFRLHSLVARAIG